MTATWPFTVAALAAAGYALRGHRGGGTGQVHPELDVAKCGQLIALAAEWLRASDVDAARNLLEQVPEQVWALARDEVVAPSDEPRIAAFADRMSAEALLSTPDGISGHADRLAQVETLNAIAAAIRTRMKPTR